MIRRDFLKHSIITASLLGIQVSSLKAKPVNKSIIKTTVAIAGAGFAGLSAAKEIKNLNPNIEVLLIEQRSHFMSCPFSNLWIGGVQNISLKDLSYDYNQAVATYGYDFLNATIVNINKESKTIQTSKQTVQYDYLILATGIEYNYKKLFKKNHAKAKECLLKAPPGLKAGSEHLALKRMVEEFSEGNFVISIPAQSYKCPPAPYERACMIAHYFKKNNIKGKVIIIDPRSKPAAKPDSFIQAFEKHHKGYIEYHNNTLFKDVDFKKNIIEVEVFNTSTYDYEIKRIPFKQASIIPPNISSQLVKKAGLATYAQGWAKLRQPTFRSVSDENIYLIGDIQGEYPYPKSAQMANSCGYIVADELVKRIKNESFKYKTNLPGNVCYSMIDANNAVSIAHLYEFKDKVKVTTITSHIDTYTADAAKGWYFGIISDILAVKL